MELGCRICRFRQVFLKCLHPECQRLDKGKGLYVASGRIPFPIDMRDEASAVQVVRHCDKSRKCLCSNTNTMTICRRAQKSQSNTEPPKSTLSWNLTTGLLFRPKYVRPQFPNLTQDLVNKVFHKSYVTINATKMLQYKLLYNHG